MYASDQSNFPLTEKEKREKSRMSIKENVEFVKSAL